MKQSKKTKIVSTLGPATSEKDTLRSMMQNGVNIFRINFSHADYEDVKERVKMIRELNKEEHFNAGILADLQGPKLRVGVMKEDVIAVDGEHIKFKTGEPFEGSANEVYMNYDTFP